MPQWSRIGQSLTAARQAFLDVVDFVAGQTKASPNAVFAGSVPYLMLAGNVVAGWQMARALIRAEEMLASGEGDAAFLKAKVATAHFYADHLLSKAPGARDAIVDGTLAPQEQLRDTELATWLGVSRTPVREALLRLASAGLVVARPGRATYVTTLDDRATRHAQSVVAAMHRLAVLEAVGQLTADDLDRMREANRRFARAVRDGDVDAALAADDDLHQVPVDASGNAAVAAVLEQFTPLLRRAERLRFSSLPGRASVARHNRLIDLCAAGDADGAAEVSWQTWRTLALDHRALVSPTETDDRDRDRRDHDREGPLR